MASPYHGSNKAKTRRSTIAVLFTLLLFCANLGTSLHPHWDVTVQSHDLLTPDSSSRFNAVNPAILLGRVHPGAECVLCEFSATVVIQATYSPSDCQSLLAVAPAAPFTAVLTVFPDCFASRSSARAPPFSV